MSAVPDEGSPRTGGAGSGTAPEGKFWALTIGSVGVVYGDIGTSPLYAFREAVKAAAGDEIATREDVLGVLSLIVWSLILVVTLKYVVLLLRADNNGEGGTLSLTALAFRALGRRTMPVLMLGVVGAAMFYGSSFITPALSVLSAVEGLKIVTPALDPFVLPITVLVLALLFAIQARGTGKMSALFGPITVIWFVAMAATGAIHIADDPEVFYALNPYYGIFFLIDNGIVGLITMGAVFLVVTGAEALYADLGHFGRKPIQAAWFMLVLPALLINYFGQGALVLANPAALDDPFFRLVPETLLLPMVCLATAATVIASQAVITGAFSLTQQAIQLGLLPRFEIRHTSEEHYGQIFMPRINMILFLGVLLLVLMFRSSSALAASYVSAVATALWVSSPLGFIVIWKLWKWSFWTTAAVMVPFMIIDTAFLIATMMKIPEGGWIPMLFGAGLIVVVVTWRRGTRILSEKTRKTEVPRVPGTAIFFTAERDSVPTTLLHNLKHNKVLHERLVFLTIVTEEVPRLPDEERTEIDVLERGRCYKVALHYGFREEPDIPHALKLLAQRGLAFDIEDTTFFLGKTMIARAEKRGLFTWRRELFRWMQKNAPTAAEYFRLPPARVIELGTQISV